MEALPSLFFRSSSQRRRVYELLRIRELESLRERGRSEVGSGVIEGGGDGSDGLSSNRQQQKKA